MAITLKTAKRSGTVSRAAIRKAVNIAYTKSAASKTSKPKTATKNKSSRKTTVKRKVAA